MNDQQPNTLTQRLDRLERENRWWKLLGIVAVVVLGLVILFEPTGSTASPGRIDVNIVAIDGKRFSPLQVSQLSPKLPVEID